MEKKTCPVCAEPIMGRQDKKFCSSQCRSEYHNKINSTSIKYIRNINQVLRKNRSILAEMNPDGKTKVPREKLILKGFNFNYFTNLYTTKQGKTYYYCYDQGYLLLDNNWIALVLKEEYIA